MIKKLCVAVALAMPYLAYAGSATISVDWDNAKLTTLQGFSQFVPNVSSRFEAGTFRERAVGDLQISGNIELPFDDPNWIYSLHGAPTSVSVNGAYGYSAWGYASANVSGGDMQVSNFPNTIVEFELGPHSAAEYKVPYSYNINAASSYLDARSYAFYFVTTNGPYYQGPYGLIHPSWGDPLNAGWNTWNTWADGFFAVDNGEKSSASGFISLLLQNPSDRDIFGTLSANLSVSAISVVPEPETYSMLMAGLGVVGFFARRRLKKQVKPA